MERCSSVQMRKNLMAVDLCARNGVDFIPMPVKDSAHRSELVAQSNAILDELVAEAKKKEGK